jgi:nitrogen regulatory protein PII
MRLIVAIIRPYHLELVESALKREDVPLTSVSEVLAGSAADGYTLIYRDREMKVCKPKYRVEFIVDDFQVNAAVEAVRAATVAGCPGNVSDAKIMVLHLEESAPVRQSAGLQSVARTCESAQFA